MALLHRAQLSPSKLEVVGDLLATRAWFRGGTLQAVGAYRFDDPEGEVGIETHLVRTDDGPVLQVPLTYRAAALPGAEASLVGTMEHSVLGRRWVYDACGDPVYVAALADVLLGEGGQAEEYFEVDGRREPRPPTVVVATTGTPGEVPVDASDQPVAVTDGDRTVVTAGGVELVVLGVLDDAATTDVEHALTGTWADRSDPVLLATARRT